MSGELVHRESREVTAAPEYTDVLAVIARAAADPSVDVAKMGALLQLQEHVMAASAKVQFEMDFARASAEMPLVSKDAKRGMGAASGVIPYASYENLNSVVTRVEQKYGFTRRFLSRPVAGGIVQVCVLSHSAGHSIESEMQLPPDPGPGRNALQAMGSSRSYGRRYLTLDVWNIVCIGADDDGEATDLITEAQAQTIDDLLTQAGMSLGTPQAKESLKRFLEFAKAPKVGQIKAGRYDEIVKMLQRKAARK
jgi:hypothetical protein